MHKVLIVGVLLLSATATADIVITPLGEPIEGGSWSQVFGLEPDTAEDAFDFMAVQMASADSFECPAMGPFSKPGWANTDLSPTLAYATGPVVTELFGLYINFEGDKDRDEDLVFDLAQYSGNTWIQTARLVWPAHSDGCEDWVVSYEGVWDPGRLDMIPAPGAALLGLIGLGCVARIRRYLA
jgi:hypothetical protein